MSVGRKRKPKKVAKPPGSGQRFIRSKAFLLGLLAFGALEVVLSWRAIDAAAPAEFSPLKATAAALATFLCIALIGSSNFLGDRLVFGPAAAAMFCHAVLAAFLPEPDTALVIRALIWLAWVAFVGGGVYTLVGSPVSWPGWGTPPEK